VTEAKGLRRSLGLFDVVLFFVVAATNLQWVAKAAANGPSSLVVWIFGGLALFLPISVAVVFLEARYPQEGGMYVWSKRAFGDFAGFLTGWTYWTSNVTYLPALLYFTAGNALYLGSAAGEPAAGSPWYFAIFALAGLTLATVLNIVGLDIGKWWKFGPATTFDASTLRPATNLKDVLFWSAIVFAWTGPEAISFMSGEVKRPRRTIPVALALAATPIAVIYIAGTAGLLAAVPAHDIDATTGVAQAISHTAHRFGWPALASIGALLVTLSCLGSAGLWTAAGGRIPFVVGVDRYLPAAFGRLHPRWRTPVAALLTQFVLSGALIVMGQVGTNVKGAYDLLVSATVITSLFPFLYIFAAAIKLRRASSSPHDTRIVSSRVVVYVTAAVGFVTTAAAIVLSLFPADDEPNKPLAVGKLLVLTAFMILSGVAIFISASRRRRAPGTPGSVVSDPA
jgi:glutamate:GABA antiporter